MDCRKQNTIVPRRTWGFDLIVNVYFFFIMILKNKKRLLKISWSKVACLGQPCYNPQAQRG